MNNSSMTSARHVKLLEEVAAAERRQEVLYQRARLAELAKEAGISPPWSPSTQSKRQTKKTPPVIV